MQIYYLQYLKLFIYIKNSLLYKIRVIGIGDLINYLIDDGNASYKLIFLYRLMDP